MRGAPLGLERPQPRHGIIPACAGSTHHGGRRLDEHGDHPRMCGEHTLTARGWIATEGSSPHVRGAPRHHHRDGVQRGIIPACAGSTTAPHTRQVPTRDHPRMCGEHSYNSLTCSRLLGSSPHVRGAPRHQRHKGDLQGIIPACAGSTATSSSIAFEHRDHPRMCGEHENWAKDKLPEEGSSPHVRGAHHDGRYWTYNTGIIPACAGSTDFGFRGNGVPRDHPRMCGEHQAPPPHPSPLPGSSPHVRGARDAGQHKGSLHGIIPACAGSTLKYLAFLGYSSAFSFGSQGSKLFTCVVSYPPNFRAL